MNVPSSPIGWLCCFLTFAWVLLWFEVDPIKAIEAKQDLKDAKKDLFTAFIRPSFERRIV